MLLKIGKTTPQCPNWLPGDEYTSESQLPIGEYTGSLDSPMMNPNVEDELNATDDTVPRGLHIALVGGDKNNPKGLDGGRNVKSRLPCDEYTGKSTS